MIFIFNILSRLWNHTSKLLSYDGNKILNSLFNQILDRLSRFVCTLIDQKSLRVSWLRFYPRVRQPRWPNFAYLHALAWQSSSCIRYIARPWNCFSWLQSLHASRNGCCDSWDWAKKPRPQSHGTPAGDSLRLSSCASRNRLLVKMAQLSAVYLRLERR